LRKEADLLERQLADGGPLEDWESPEMLAELVREFRADADRLDPPKPMFVLWLRTGRFDWTPKQWAETRDELRPPIRFDGWPRGSSPVAWIVLPEGQEPGPDTRPDGEYGWDEEEGAQ
jgi:hypothetical protein